MDRSELDIALVTPDIKTREEFSDFPWVPENDSESSSAQRSRWTSANVSRRIGYWMYMSLAYRFNTRCGFEGVRQLRHLNLDRRQAATRVGNAAHPWLGFPFASSRTLYETLDKLYHLGWQSRPAVERIFDRFRPDLLLLSHMQNADIESYVLAARRRGIPIVGMTGSWDQPTTKGPIPRTLSCYAVQSEYVAKAITKWHGIDRNRVRVLGWPQMDWYRLPGIVQPRAEFLHGLGLDSNARLITYGANSSRLGSHEPELLRRLAQQVTNGDYGSTTTLIVRCHPNDPVAYSAMKPLHNPSKVQVHAPDLSDLPALANLMTHSDVVLATAGTVLLDAIAMDAPAIGIAVSLDRTVPYERLPERIYELDHNASAIESGAIPLVRTLGELDHEIHAVLGGGDTRAEARCRLRASHLEPLDGHASERLVDLIAEQTGLALSGR